MKHGIEYAFVVERMVEGGKWIPWKCRIGRLCDILNDLQQMFSVDALNSLRVRKPC